MFVCPNCTCDLTRQMGPHGVSWRCEQCGGLAIGISPLRSLIGDEPVRAAWAQVINEPIPDGKACPVCARAMFRVAVPGKEKSLELDLCKRCEFMWLDAGEFEALRAAPKVVPPGQTDERDLPQAAREALAMERVRELSREEQNEPDEEWKTIPALLGMPVEMESFPLKRLPWATYSTAVLIAVISLAAFPHLSRNVHQFGLIPAEALRLHGLTMLTSFFLHADVFHLGGNLYFLVIFGQAVEDYLGRARWLLLLVVAALVGDGAHILGDPHATYPASAPAEESPA